MSAARGVATVEHELGYVDAVPDALLRRAVRVRLGTLRERVGGIAAWRSALLTGDLPAKPWPPGPIGVAARDALVALGIAPFCKGRVELVDAIVEGLLEDVAVSLTGAAPGVERRLAELLAAEAAKVKHPTTKPSLRVKLAQPSAVRVAELRRRAEAEFDEQMAVAIGHGLQLRWADKVAVWKQVADVFGDLGDLLGAGWDLSQGVLALHGWQDLVALQKLLESEARLRDLVAALGRESRTRTGEEVSMIERIASALSRAGEVIRDVPAPGIPPDVRGVTRSDDLSRLLPSETALLRHPMARRLFLARLAEKALSTYQVEGVEPQRIEAIVEETGEVEREVRRPADGAGPILLCVDTSGSMAGAPETMAKAIALEAMRVAHKEGRRCFLWSFSGPGQVEPHELSLSADGVAKLLAFLLASFHGGTDVGAPVAAACAKLTEEDWRRADLAIITDGGFAVSSETRDHLAAARAERGLRVRGVLVGAGDSGGLADVTDEVEHLSSWSCLR